MISDIRILVNKLYSISTKTQLGNNQSKNFDFESYWKREAEEIIKRYINNK